MQVFFSSPWIPAEWVQAHGLIPRRLWPDQPDNLPVPEGVCAFAQSASRFAESHPESVTILASSCDQMRRACDDLESRHPRLFLFNLPATWQSAVARQMYRDEMRRLGRFLQGCGGVPPVAETLATVLRAHDQARTRLRTGVPGLPARAGAQAVAQFHWDAQVPAAVLALEGSAHRAETEFTDRAGAARLALVGGPLTAAHWPLLEAVEAAGARVALNATESGERSLLPQLLEGDELREPVASLADAYFDHLTDVFQRPNTRLYEWLGAGLRQRGIRGLVVWSWSWCDLWRAEAASLREAFGLPVLLLEAGESLGEVPRELGRLQAFLEMLR